MDNELVQSIATLRLIFTMARTLRATPSTLQIAIRFLAGAYAPGHQAAAAVSRPRE
jgi:hypothetical protein